MTEEQYEKCLDDVSNKINGINDFDWSEIIENNGLHIHFDTLRKAQQTIFGGYFVREYYRQKNLKKETTLSQAKKIIGEQIVIKKQIQSDKSEIRKMQNGFIKSISIAEELAQILEDNNFQVNVPEYCHVEIDDKSEYKMIVHITDWHIGYVIENCKGNYYNWEIANERINKLINECRKYIRMYEIKKVYVMNTGDMIEHISMRKNQSQFCEFNQSEQINHAIDLIYRFLVALCRDCTVEYDSIYGNHDRMNGDLSANLDGDNADTIIREQISKYKELSNNLRLNVIQRRHTDKEIVTEIEGLKCRFSHGNVGVKNDKTQLRNSMSMNNEFYNLSFDGHEHNFRMVSENNGRYIIHTGCLSGFNDYSVGFGCTTVASQTIAIVKNNYVELVKDVQLN